ncbi:homocysteine S-methyltransferase family protein [candidate division WOR-3 bacterium]|nr:homocysteine S-methyltransferase family protein [candidate division WOR-3 bacterium]
MDFRSFLNRNKVIILDGAMGTELERRGALGRCNSNLTNPEIVEEIHRDYFNAGSNAVIANTFSMTRLYIETHNLKIDVEEVNRSGVKSAKDAAGEEGYVLGDIGSTAQMLEPYGTCKEEDLYNTFKEQASILSEAGVDGFIIETIFDLREALSAVRACRDVSGIPVIASMSFQTVKNGGRTMMGNSAEECAIRLTEGGADAVGTNCGNLAPKEMAEIVSIMKESTTLPIAAQPNAGKPKLEGGKVFYMKPKLYATETLECYKAGASIIGGCCGTTPEHIRILSDLIAKETGKKKEKN